MAKKRLKEKYRKEKPNPNFEEWKRVFTKKVDRSIKAFQDMHEYLHKDIDGHYNGSDFLIFVGRRATEIEEAINLLKATTDMRKRM